MGIDNRQQLVIAGVIGLIAAVLVGAGEFLLHFDPLGRFGEAGGYAFMQGIDAGRASVGHFIGVLAAPLYIIGFWHIMKMLEPANRMASRIAFAIMSYGIIIGAVWIGSRSSVSGLINFSDVSSVSSLIAAYELRYENLLQITRLAVLGFSVIFVWLVFSGRSHYPRWVAGLNPILLILVSFAIWAVAPAVGIYLMPIALNVAFAVLFVFSIFYSKSIKG
ncbi:hypothetical protein F3F96_08575 [Mariprofundus sp. NF]|uniref:DUF6796 family protein n=1 Tax=Mariprofundus sp. NF TaxID=2608716 RepID=UPI0015A38217|nr:DUF6796 family protein [Mariprofundus sp. NF]NWF39188.1 hypothetical protein [Mariprofundus sp. NF]